MPSDLSIRPINAISPPGTATGEPPSPAASDGVQAKHAQPLPNPTLQLDQQLGIVVIEFHNAAGTVTSSIPTEKQLDAYRTTIRTEAGLPGTHATQPAPGAAEHTANTQPASQPARRDSDRGI